MTEHSDFSMCFNVPKAASRSVGSRVWRAENGVKSDLIQYSSPTEPHIYITAGAESAEIGKKSSYSATWSVCQG